MADGFSDGDISEMILDSVISGTELDSLPIISPEMDSSEVDIIADSWRDIQKDKILEAFPDVVSERPELIDGFLNDTTEGLKRLGRSSEVGTTIDVVGRVLGSFGKGLGDVVDLLPGVEGVGESIRDTVEEIIPPDFSRETARQTTGGDFLDLGADVTGQVASIFAPGGLLAKAAKGVKGVATGGTLLSGFAQSHDAAYKAHQEVLRRTNDKEKASSEYYTQLAINGGLNIPQTLILGKLAGRLGSAVGKTKAPVNQFKTINKSVGERLLSTGKVAGAEAFEEGTQGLLSEASLSKTIDNTPYIDSLTDSTNLKNAIIEGLAGGFGGGLSGGAIELGTGRDLNTRIKANRERIVQQATSRSSDIFIEGEIPKFKISENMLGDVNEAISAMDALIDETESEASRRILVEERNSLAQDRDSAIQEFQKRAEDEGRTEEFKAHLQKQGVSLPSTIENVIPGLEEELAQVESQLEGTIPTEQRKQLAARQKELTKQLEGTTETLSAIDEEIKQEDFETDEEETALIEERAFFRTRQVQDQKELAQVESEIGELRPITPAQTKAIETKASNIKQTIDAVKEFAGKTEITQVGNTRMVATDVNKDVADFTGSILAGFDIDRALVLASTDVALNKGARDALLREGIRLEQPRKAKGRALPTAFTAVQGLENDAIIIPEKELTPRNAEAISHEIGHVIAEDLLIKNPRVRDLLDTEYKKAIAGKDFNQRGVEQKLPQRQAEDKNLSSKKQLSFQEWMADNTGRYIQNKNLEAKSPIEKFFKELAESLRNIYNKLTGSPKLKVNKTLEAFLDEHFNQERVNAYLENRRGDEQGKVTQETTRQRQPRQDTEDSQDNTREASEVLQQERRSVLDRRVQSKKNLRDFLLKKAAEKRKQRTEADQKALDESLEEQGFAEEDLEVSDDFVSSLEEVFGSKEARIGNKLFASIMGKSKLSKDALDYLKKNANKDHAILSRETVLSDVDGFIAEVGILDAEDLFFDEEIGMKPNFKVGLGVRLQEMYDNLAVELKKQGLIEEAKLVREKQFDITNDLIKKVAVDLGRGVDMLKLAINTNSVSGIQRVVQKYFDQIAKNNGVENATLSNETKQEISGLAEEILDAKAVGDQAALNKLQQIMHQTVLKDSRVRLSDILSNTWYQNKLSGLSTTVGLNNVANITSHSLLALSNATNSRAFRQSYGRAVRNGLGLGLKQAYNTLRGFNSTADLSKYDISKSQDDLLSQVSNRINELSSKEDLTSKEQTELWALKAYNPVGKIGNFLSFRMLQAGDEFAFTTNKEVYMRGFVASEILKNDPNLTKEDLQNKVTEALTGGKDLDTRRAEAEDRVRKVLSSERIAEMSEKEFNALVQDSLFENTKNIVSEQFGDSLIQDAEFFAEKAVFKNDVEGLLSLPSQFVGLIGAQVNLLTKNENKAVQMLGFAGKAAQLATVPFNKTVFNATNMALEFSPIGFFKEITTRKAGNRAFQGFEKKSPKFRSVSEFELKQMRTNAYMGSALMLTVGAFIFADWDDDSFIKFHGNFKTLDKGTRQILKESGIEEYSISIGDANVSFRDTALRGFFGPIADLSNKLRYGAEQVTSPVTGEKKKLRELSQEEKNLYIRDDIIDRLALATSSIMFTVIDTSPLGGFTVLEALADPEGGAGVLEKTLSNISGGFTNPRILNDIGSFISDPKLDRTATFANLYSNAPFASRALGKEEVGLFGESIIRKDFISDRIIRGKSDDKDYQFLVKNNVYPSAYDRTTKIQSFRGDDTQRKTLVSQRLQDNKISAFKVNVFTEDESYELHKKYTGPLYRKIVSSVRENAGIKTPEEIRDELNERFKKAREIAQRQYLDEKYKTSLFRDKHKAEIKKITGD